MKERKFMDEKNLESKALKRISKLLNFYRNYFPKAPEYISMKEDLDKICKKFEEVKPITIDTPTQKDYYNNFYADLSLKNGDVKKISKKNFKNILFALFYEYKENQNVYSSYYFPSILDRLKSSKKTHTREIIYVINEILINRDFIEEQDYQNINELKVILEENKNKRNASIF